jgi:16S rRNA G1207 methylase RsmC
MPDLPTDAYFKKEVTLIHAGKTLRFRTSDALFSSHDIDDGTRLLLKTLTSDVIAGRNRVLDIGCGYGPLGIALAAAGASYVEMVDRDALAVMYAQQNAALNDVEVRAHGSLGYDDVDREFDLIVSNIPAKAGSLVIRHLLMDARRHLAPGGLVAVVVIEPIAAEVESVLRSDAVVDVIFERRAPEYSVFHYAFVGPTVETDGSDGLGRGLYEKQPPPSSSLLLEALPHRGVESPIIVNPAPDVVSALDARRVQLIGRDLLWLRTSAESARGEATIAHVASVAEGGATELIVASLIEDEGRAAHEEQMAGLAGRLAPGGAMIVAGASTAITRVESFVRARKLLRVEGRRRKRGESILVLRATSS